VTLRDRFTCFESGDGIHRTFPTVIPNVVVVVLVLVLVLVVVVVVVVVVGLAAPARTPPRVLRDYTGRPALSQGSARSLTP